MILIKRLVLFFLLPAALSLCGCGSGASEVGGYITRPFECSVTLTCETSEYTLAAAKGGADLLTLTVVEPASLAGLSAVSGGGETQSFDDMTASLSLPQTAFAKVFAAAFSEPLDGQIHKTDSGYERSFDYAGTTGILLLDAFSYAPVSLKWGAYSAVFSDYKTV